MFEWDEVKRRKTLEKHGIDFLDLGPLFDSQHILTDARSEHEARKIAIGRLDDVIVAVIFTERNGRIRIITARRARKNERDSFRALHAGAAPADEGQD